MMVDERLIGEVRRFLDEFQIGQRLVDVGFSRLLWLLGAYLAKRGYRYRKELVYVALCSCLGILPGYLRDGGGPYLPAPRHSQPAITLNTASLSTTLTGATSSVKLFLPGRVNGP